MENDYNSEKFTKGTYSQRNPCMLKLTSNERTTHENHFQDVRLLKFDKPNDLNYQPGDVLMLVPQNSQEKTDVLFKILNENRGDDQKFHGCDLVQIMAKDADMPVPEPLRHPIRLSECAKKYWDLNVCVLFVIYF